MARHKKNKTPEPVPETEPVSETEPETEPVPETETAEKACLVVTRKVALGNGTREPGFVLGEIKDIENLSPEGIIPAEGVIEAEIINALANGDVYKVQA